MAHDKASTLVLPVSVVGRIDVGRLLREAEALDEFLNQAAIRKPGTPVKMPKTSRLMDEILQINQLNVLHEKERQQLLDFLHTVKNSAPVMHMSFSADPPPLFTGKLMTWLRREIHPLLLLQVGLQPNIGAGALVRTTNKYYDFSLREKFMAKRQMLSDLIAGRDKPATKQADTPKKAASTAVSVHVEQASESEPRSEAAK